MLAVLAIILLVAWLLGLVAFHVTAGFFHIVLLAAIVFFILHLARGRRSTV